MSYIGTTKIGKIFLGNTEIERAYLGTDLVFQNTTPTPPTPQEVEYIVNTSLGAYIDTGISPFKNMRVIIDADVPEAAGSVFGSRIALNNAMFAMTAPGGTNTGKIRFDYANATHLISGNTGAKHSYGMLGDSGQIYIDNSKVGTFTSTTINNSNNIHLFGWNDNGTHSDPSQQIKIYSFSLFNGSTRILQLRPYRIGTVGCFKDMLTDTFYYNAGSGDFGYGNDVV